MKLVSVLLLVFTSSLFQICQAQSIRKKTEKSYRQISQGDSVLSFEKTTEYNYRGAVVSQHENYYSLHPAGVLIKEVSAVFDSTKMLLDEHIYQYKSSGTDHERLKTKYLSYAPKESESKYFWRQYYDITEEIVREDTLSYDKAGNLISRMLFDYRGSTSQSEDVYTFDKKNRLKCWKWYNYWSTVNSKSKPVTNKDKRQDYKYQYNKAGKLTKVSGKRYSTSLLETYKYDNNGKVFEYQQIKKKKSKNTISERKQKGKFSISEEKLIKKYQNGFLIFESQLFNDKETSRTEICYYKDSLMISKTLYQKGEKSNETIFEYGADDSIFKKITQNYLNNRKHTLVIYSFDSNENLLSEIKTLNGEELSRIEYAYYEHSNLKQIRTYMKTKNGIQLSESTLFEYEFY